MNKKYNRGGSASKRYITNNQIKSREIRLIGADGSQVGIVQTTEAIRLAEEQSLDLLLLTPDTDPPVCKIVNLGQHKYEQSKKNKQAKKNKPQVTKEIKLSPKISDNDFQTKLRLGQKFLGKSYNVKLSVFFKGRENARKDLGNVLIERYIEEIKDLGSLQGDIAPGHRSIYVIIQPLK